MNSISLTGVVTKVYPVRYTINKVAVLAFILQHESQQLEFGTKRLSKFKIYCTYLGQESLNILNQYIEIKGFLNTNLRQELVLHVNTIIIQDKG